MQSKDTHAPERRRSTCAVARGHAPRDIQPTRGTAACVIAIARRGIAISLQTIEL